MQAQQRNGEISIEGHDGLDVMVHQSVWMPGYLRMSWSDVRRVSAACQRKQGAGVQEHVHRKSAGHSAPDSGSAGS